MEEQLRRAAMEGDLPALQRILQQPAGGGFIVNAANERGVTALHIAAEFSEMEIIQAILQVEGVNVDPRTVTGRTPLHWAGFFGAPNARLPFFQALLEAGADPNAADADGATPLFIAICQECPISVVEALLDAGAYPAARDSNLDNFLHDACRHFRLDVVQLLIRRRSLECLTCKNHDEETPLDVVRSHSLSKKEAVASIRKHILQTYAGTIAQRHGLYCLHAVLQDTAFTADEEDEELYQLPVGKLIAEHLQMLLEYIIAMEPGSVRALNSDGLIPVQYASELNFPASVLYVLLRPDPNMLSNPEVKRESSANRSKQGKPRKLQRI